MGFRGVRLRNIRARQLAIADRVHVGDVARFDEQTFVCNFGGGGRPTNTVRSALPIRGAHHVGRNYHAHDCISRALVFPLPSHVRLAYIDTRKLQWCSVGSGFSVVCLARSIREATSIAHT